MPDDQKKTRYVIKPSWRTEAQKLFWRSDAQFTAYIGGYGSGKSFASAFKMLMQPAGSVGICVAPTFSMLEQSIMAEFHKLCDKCQIPYNLVRGVFMRTHLANGTIIYWRSAEQLHKIRGINADWFAIDEACYCKDGRELWQVLLGRIRNSKNTKGWVTSTPLGFDWVYDIFGADPLPDGFELFRASTRENKHLPESYLKNLESTLSSAQASQELDGLFVDLKNSRISRDWFKYFPSSDANPLLSDDGVPLNKDGQRLNVILGVDLAISIKNHADYTAIVASAFDPQDGKRYVLDVDRKRVGFHGGMDFIEQMATKWKPSRINIEGVAFQKATSESLLKRTSLPIKPYMPGSKSKDYRFLPVEAQLEHGNVYFTEGLKKSYFEDELLSFPNGKHDDCCDALQMSLDIPTRRIGRIIG